MVATSGYSHKLIEIKNSVIPSQMPPLPPLKCSTATGGTAQTQNISVTGASSATESATLENTVLCNQTLFVMLETNLHLLEIITHSSHCFRKSPSFSAPTPGCPVSSLLSYSGGLGGLPGKVRHFLGNFNPVFAVGEECISQTLGTLGVKSLCRT